MLPCMSLAGRLRLCLVIVVAASALLLAGPASADELQDCIDQGNAQGIDMPTCVDNGDGKLTPVVSDNGFGSDDGFGPDGGMGIPGWFVVLIVLIIASGIATTYWRMQVARRLAKDAGMDPDVAAGMTLLDNQGLSTTYLASSLRTAKPAEPTPTPAAAAPSHESATDRLNELRTLLDGGLITQVEYDERRKAILDSL
jgi:hypothetical protein